MKYCLFNIAFWGLLFFNLFEAAANLNIYTISGRVTEVKTNSPLPGTSILIDGTYLWAVSNQKGEFTIQGVQEGKYNPVSYTHLDVYKRQLFRLHSSSGIAYYDCRVPDRTPFKS